MLLIPPGSSAGSLLAGRWHSADCNPHKGKTRLARASHASEKRTRIGYWERGRMRPRRAHTRAHVNRHLRPTDGQHAFNM
eukprot:5768876-Pleurochrysis_carterae.AAC.1